MSSSGITSYKLESVPAQRLNTNRVSSFINLTNVNLLTETLGYKAIGLRKHELYGVINLIYFVEVENGDERKEWVLRVTNPWSRWTGRLPRNEATVLMAIQRWNESCETIEQRIPAPKILVFSADAATSILRCEFSLAEKLPGENGSTAIGQLNAEKRQVLWSDFLRAHLNVASIPASFLFAGKTESEIDELSNTIGSFSNWPEGLGPLIMDGPGVGPSRTYAALMVELLQKSIADLDASETLSLTLLTSDIELLKTRISRFLQNIETGAIDPNKIWPNSDKFALCHDDLHPGNILVDPETGHLTGLLDWDRVQWGIHADQAREWCACMADELFAPPDSYKAMTLEGEIAPSIPEHPHDEYLLLKAMSQLDMVYPETLEMKLRTTWSALPFNLAWMTNYLASWLGPQKADSRGDPLPDNIKDYTSHHKTHWRSVMKWLDHLEMELEKGPLSAFSECPDYSDAESVDSGAEEDDIM